MAVAGLFDDLGYKPNALLENKNRNEYSVANARESIAKAIHPMDRQKLPTSHPCVATHVSFDRWLLQEVPQYTDAATAMAGLSNEQMDVCKSGYTDMVRICRDDWNHAANALENQLIERHWVTDEALDQPFGVPLH